jgi:hypothetical protein
MTQLPRLRLRWLVSAAVWVSACGGGNAAEDAAVVDVRDAAGLDAAGLDAHGSLAADAAGTDAASVPSDAAQGDAQSTSELDAAGRALALPPPNGGLDYQLGGAYAPPVGVTIVSRDRLAAPAPGLYNVCYVNGFQTQPGEEGFWLEDHPDLVLRDAAGDPVIDPDWDEMLLDVSDPDKRARLAAIVGGWMEGCALAGFDAVEIDNLDTYSRSGGRIAQADAIAFMRLLADAAHAQGLAIAQKNSAEIVGHRAEMNTDFAIVEECSRYDECAVFTDVYGPAVLMIEYRRTDFDAGCRDFPEHSIVLRDLDLVSPGEPGYVYDAC